MLNRVGGVAAFGLVCISLVISGCKGDFSAGPFPPEFPLLNDPIPWEDLASGILLFQRLGPEGNNYIGAYAVDILQQRSLGYSTIPVHEPSISPDGYNVAFTTFTTVPNAEDVYVMDIENTTRLWVSELAGHEQSPSWSADAKQIFFLCVPFTSSGDSVQLYRQSPVPRPRDRVLIFDSGKRNPRISLRGPVSASSAGTLLAGGRDGIWTISGDGSQASLLIPAPGGGTMLYSPAWSPDGQNIALLAVTRNAASITSVAVVVYAADGGGADTLVSLPASGTKEWPGNNNYSLCWSPDGSQIAFTRPDGKDVGAHIYAIRKDHTGLVQVTNAPGVTDRSLSWGKEIPVQGKIRGGG